MENTARFWVGIGMYALEVLVIIGFGLSKLEQKTLIVGGLITIFLAYNILAGICTWTGSSKKRNGKDGKKTKGK